MADLHATAFTSKATRGEVIIVSLATFIVFFQGLMVAPAFVGNVDQMIMVKLLAGISSAGIAPTTISWISDRFPYKERGYALGIFFGCMAGGTAFGSSTGSRPCSAFCFSTRSSPATGTSTRKSPPRSARPKSTRRR